MFLQRKGCLLLCMQMGGCLCHGEVALTWDRDSRDSRPTVSRKGGQIESPWMTVGFPSRVSEISEFVGDVLIWWLPATDEDNPLLLNDALIVAEMENASNDQECGVLVVLQSLGTRTNVCVQREGNNDLPVEATVSWSVEATVSWWVSRNTAPSFRC